MSDQDFVQGGNTVPVTISIQAGNTAAAARKSFKQLIEDAAVLTSEQVAAIIGGVVLARQPASGAPPTATPAARAAFSFGYNPDPVASPGIADAKLNDYAGAGEELDLKAVGWLRTTFPLSMDNNAVPAVVRVYLRFT
jgi:hypothetical protein